MLGNASIAYNSGPCAQKARPLKVFGIAGYSVSGKTTLLEKVIPLAPDAFISLQQSRREAGHETADQSLAYDFFRSGTTPSDVKHRPGGGA